MIDFKRLADPFFANDVEWRLQECGKKNDKIWAMCLAYITNRAIMQRLDDVCGPENWMNEYKAGPQGGVICGISIRCVDGWVTKWDGADNTQVEATKGGLSDAMKRAGVQWGIGRYLYNLEAGFAEIVPEGKKGEYRGKTKDNTYFQWNPPKLPAWALPSNAPPPQEQQQRQAPPAPDAPPPPQQGQPGQQGQKKPPTKDPATPDQRAKIADLILAIQNRDGGTEAAILKTISHFVQNDKEYFLTPETLAKNCSKGWAGKIIGKAEGMLKPPQ